MRKLLIRLLIRWLDRTVQVDYSRIDRVAMQKWLFESFESTGWKSYFKYHDLKILKEMGFGLDRERYLELVGQRMRLLLLHQDMQKAWQEEKRRQAREALKKKQEEKE